ncbi:MAG: DUF2339 domain-containing protein, partial [Alcanivoracaceae bacterium]|nr:DUF2339 domain-containing protein [Alcanivoracaceae bacterium]
FMENKADVQLIPWLNADYIGTLIITLAATFVGLYSRANSHKLLSVEERLIPTSMIVAAAFWWIYGGISEINLHYYNIRFLLMELFLSISSIVLLILANRIKFKLLKAISFVLALIMLVLVEIIPDINTGNIMFWNVRFIGLMVLAVFHLILSWYWDSKKRHGMIRIFNLVSVVFIFTGLSSWLYGLSYELISYYPDEQFVLIEIMMAISAIMLLNTGLKLKLNNFKFASVVITLLMVLPIMLIPQSDSTLPVLFNIPFLGLLIYAITNYGMSWYWQRKNSQLNSLFNKSLELPISHVLLGFALTIWVIMGHNELYTYLQQPHFINATLIFMMASFVLWVFVAHKLVWKSLHMLRYAYLPYLMVISYYILALGYEFHDGIGLLVWFFAALINYWILRVYDVGKKGDKFIRADIYHIVGLLLFSLIMVLEFVELIGMLFGEGSIWHYSSYAFMLLLITSTVFMLRKTSVWPFVRYYHAYFNQGLLISIMVLWLLVVVMNLSKPGVLTFFPYLPIFNVMDFVGIFFVLLVWKMLQSHLLSPTKEREKMVLIILPITAFLILNTSMLRGFHFWYNIEYKWSSMLSSFVVQSGFSILWSLTAVALMVLSARKTWRKVWLVGLGLMIAVVIKLFLVDMSASGTVERIVAFLSVGVLLSLVGYFSPLPPDDENILQQAQTEKEKS